MEPEVSERPNGHPIENRTFFLFLVAITIILVWTVWAFAAPILWAAVAAITFTPLQDRLFGRTPAKPGRSAAAMVGIIAAGIILPLTLLAVIFVGEAGNLYGRIRAGEVDPGRMFVQLQARLPDWLQGLMQRAGMGDLQSLRAKISQAVEAQFQTLASKALSIGSGLFGFILALIVMLYLTFYLLRYGRELVAKAGEAIPLQPHRRAKLADQFVSVIRATVKGSVVVAIVQGTVGGIVMAILGVPEALLWAVVMGFSSLLPAVGTGLVWVPASLYLFAVGNTWQGIAMALSGLLVIGSLDNILRPILVGRETKVPDALVLITTLGGLSAFGFSGLIIGPVAAALFLAAWNMVREDRAAVSG